MEKTRLGDIATLINGDRGKNYPSQADITDKGDIPFVNAGHLNGRNIDFDKMNYISGDKYNRLNSGRFMKGDILYCLRGSLGKKALVNEDMVGAIASSLVIIRPDYNRIDAEYLMLSLDSSSIKEQLTKANNGSSQPNLSAASVRDYQIIIPDIQKQKDIARKLSKVRTVIDSRQHELYLLENLIKARFVEMFGDPVRNEKEWQTKALEDACKSIVDCPHSTPSYTSEDTGFMCIRTSIVKKNRIMWENIEYIPEEEYIQRIQRKRPEKGDVIYTREGAILGIAAVIDRDCNVALGQRSMLLSPDRSFCTPEFISVAMNFDSFLDNALKGMSGSASPHINVGDIKAFKMILPPISQQETFSAFVAQVDKSKSVVQKSLDEAQLLFDSLMQQYFG